LGDERLQGDTPKVGLLISLAGAAGLTYPDLEGFLPNASRDRLRHAVQLLERTKWILREAGGRGHGDRFTFLASEESAPYTGFRLAIFDNLSDRMPESGTLRALSVGKPGTLKPPSSTPPSLPPPVPDARARERVEKPSVGDEVKATVHKSDELLAGCRDSLLDYLTVRVDPRYQGAYVQRVVTSLQGADEWMWKDRTGRTLTDGRTKVLAAAFNELASGDEVGQHFPEPPGGFGNLRSKVRYLVASSLGVDRDSAKSIATKPPTTARRGTFPEPTRSTTDAA
jgi:hypothetical protein